jgi:perosamine synthetase
MTTKMHLDHTEAAPAAAPTLAGPATPFPVPYSPVGTCLGRAELDAVERTVTSGRSLSCGDERRAFEAEFSQLTGAAHTLSLTNCTIALELATYLLNLEPGDEVITTPLSYQATITPLLMGPARVVFADIDPDTLNIDPASVERLMTRRTKAVYLVHYGGSLADMEALRSFCAPRGIRIVEDCAHSLGAEDEGYRPGDQGALACFSFQSYKNISTLGEGGAISLDDPDEAAVLHRITSIEPDADFAPRASTSLGPHPRPGDAVFRHEKNAYVEDCVALRHPGTNSTLAEPAAAVGRVQLKRLDELVEARRRIAERLDRVLAAADGARSAGARPGTRSAHHLYSALLEPSAYSQDAVLQALIAGGVEVQQRYFPLHLLPEWRFHGSCYGDCPVAEQVWFHQLVNLPIYPQMTERQLSHLENALAEALRRGRR